MKLPSFIVDKPRRRGRTAGFTLTELMVGLGILAVGMAIAYPFMVSSLELYARNFSINKSNNSLRYSLQVLKRDINMAIEPPTLATYTVTGSTAKITPLPDSTVAAQAILVYVNFGPAYNMPSSTGDHFTAITNPAAGITLVGHFITATGNNQQKGLPAIGDRLLITSPSPSSPGMPETITSGGVTYTKPGRRITGVTLLANSAAAGLKFTVTIDQSNTPLPSSPYPFGDQAVYLFHESAYMAYNQTDANGNITERQLRYVENTANITSPRILVRDLDPDPKEIDSITSATVAPLSTNKVVQPFNYYGGRGNYSSLTVNLPIRAFDYAHAIAERRLAAGQVDVSSESNVFIRSNPLMGMKFRMD